MKAGVITFHSAHNYGASLQTWALQQALKKLDVEPCVIHYHPEIIDRLYRAPKQDTFAKKRRYLLKNASIAGLVLSSRTEIAVKSFRLSSTSFRYCASDTPDEFLSEIEGAEFVLTNSFHGTVFSIIYEKPFVSMLHTSTGTRTSDLLKTLGLEDHILYQTSQFQEFSQLLIKDKEALRKRVAQLQKESYQFLRDALFH